MSVCLMRGGALWMHSERERHTQRVFGFELNYLCLTQCDHSFGPDF